MLNHELLHQRPSYEMAEVIAAVLTSLEQQIRRHPPELIIEIILEGYRQEHRILASGQLRDDAPYMSTELFERAHADGKLPTGVDVWHLAGPAQSVVTEGASSGRGYLRRQIVGGCCWRRHHAARCRLRCTVNKR
jgi:hypothetical protein